VSPDRIGRLAARSALRNPRQAWRRLRRQKLKAAARLVRALPGAWQRRIGGALEAAALRMVRGRVDDPTGAPLLLFADAARGHATEALAAAERLGTAPTTNPRTALRLARMCLALDALGPAGRIAAAVADRAPRQTRAALALQAEIAVQSGRYSAAADLARRSLEIRESSTARAALERAESELRVLEPGWRPSLGDRRSGAPDRRSVAGGRRRPARTRIEPVRGRVLHLLTNSLPQRQAGYTVRAQSIGLSQIAVGLDPHFATRAGFPLNLGVLRAPAEERVDGVPYHRLAPNFDPRAGPERIALETARAAERLVARLRPAVLHPASNFLNAQVALALRDRFGLPVVYEVRGFLEETWASRQDRGDDGTEDEALDADRYRGEKAAETDAMLAADAVVTLSEKMREDILLRGCHPDAVVVVPNAVDVDRFVPRPRDDALAASLGIEPGETVLGYVSTLSVYEGIRYLIEAAALLRDRGRRVRVLLVGDGEERAALEAEAGRLGLDDGTVIFTGRVPHADIQRYYSIIDVFVVPRTNDRVSRLVTPLKPFEAMALERAVVVSGVDALLEIVSDGETGLTFRPEDPVNLADVLEPLLEDPGRRAALGSAARAWVAAHRTWRQNGERYRALYERLGAA
jgi:glycosyltransferase involved in cell wall biosynthesis